MNLIKIAKYRQQCTEISNIVEHNSSWSENKKISKIIIRYFVLRAILLEKFANFAVLKTKRLHVDWLLIDKGYYINFKDA